MEFSHYTYETKRNLLFVLKNSSLHFICRCQRICSPEKKEIIKTTATKMKPTIKKLEQKQLSDKKY